MSTSLFVRRPSRLGDECAVRKLTGTVPFLAERLEGRVLMSAGQLDPTYGTAGISHFTATDAQYFIVDAAVQTDGKVVALLENGTFNQQALARFDAAGTLDTSFGGGIINGGFSSQLSFKGVALQSDGKVIVAGSDTSGAVIALRFTPGGQLDASGFGSSGIATFTDSSTFFNMSGLAIRPDNRIVIAGTGSQTGAEDFAVVALTANGQTDTSFGGGSGLATADFVGGTDEAASVALFGDGRIAVGGTTNPVQSETTFAAFALFSGTGTLDPSFGSGGEILATTLSGGDGHIVVQGGNKIVAFSKSGSSGPGVVARFNANGTPDTSFGGGDGVVTVFPTLGIDSGDVVVDSAGKLDVLQTAISGSGRSFAGFALTRLNDDGSADNSFGTNGIVEPEEPSNADRILFTADKKIIVLADTPGTQSGTQTLILARYDGTHGPVPTLASTKTSRSANTITMTVTLTGVDFAVNPSTIGASDMHLTGPNGYDQVASSASAGTASGNSLPVIYTFAAPGATLDPGDNGNYSIVAQANEVADTNGTFVQAGPFAAFAVAVGQVLPDLVFAGTTYQAGEYQSGDTINANILTATVGGTPGAFQTQLFLSTDQTIGNADDFLLNTIDGTVAGTPVTSIGPIPQGILPGKYFLVARLDTANVVNESNEDNNTFISPTAGIDLVTPPPPVASESIGGLDTTFAGTGIIRPQLGLTHTAGILQLPNGKYVIAGFGSGGGNLDIALAQLNSDTSPDTSFGDSNGTVFADLRGTDDRISDFTVLSDGHILVAGTTTEVVGGQTVGSDFFLARFTADGHLDTTFNGTGSVITDFSTDKAGHPSTDVAHDLLVRTDGKIIVAGRSGAGGTGSDFALARYNADGSLDTTFGGTGKVLTDFAGGDDGAQALAISSAGSLIAVGFAGQGSEKHIALAQYDDTGVLDPKFGPAGKVITVAGGTDERANAVAIGAKGQIVVAGFSAIGTGAGGNFSSDIVVARYSAKGAIDRKFGSGGVARAGFTQPANATQVLVLPDGRIFASGVTSADIVAGQTLRFDLALVRFTTTGGLDTSFGTNGKAIITTADPTGSPSAVMSNSLLRASPFADAAAQTIDDFQNSAEGKISGAQGGGALIAGTNGDETVVAQVVNSGVELSGALIAKLPVAVVGGGKGSATINVTNVGDLTANGLMEIDFFTSTDQTLGNGDRKFFTLSNQKVSLKPLTFKGKPKAFKAKFTFPTDIPDGVYFLLAQVNATRTITELNVNNDTAFSDQSVQIAAPFVDLAGKTLKGGVKLTAGKNASLPLTLANDGNLLFKGSTDLLVFLSDDDTLDSGDTSITPSPVKLSLTSKQSHAVKARIAVPNLSAGNYFVFVRINPSNTIQEKSVANNVLSSALPSPLS